MPSKIIRYDVYGSQCDSDQLRKFLCKFPYIMTGHPYAIMEAFNILRGNGEIFEITIGDFTDYGFGGTKFPYIMTASDAVLVAFVLAGGSFVEDLVDA